jgi:hypothetical protein
MAKVLLFAIFSCSSDMQGTPPETRSDWIHRFSHYIL